MNGAQHRRPNGRLRGRVAAPHTRSTSPPEIARRAGTVDSGVWARFGILRSSRDARIRATAATRVGAAPCQTARNWPHPTPGGQARTLCIGRWTRPIIRSVSSVELPLLDPAVAHDRLRFASRRLAELSGLAGGRLANADALERTQLLQEFFFHVVGAAEFVAQLANERRPPADPIEKVTLSSLDTGAQRTDLSVWCTGDPVFQVKKAIAVGSGARARCTR